MLQRLGEQNIVGATFGSSQVCQTMGTEEKSVHGVLVAHCLQVDMCIPSGRESFKAFNGCMF